MIKSVAFVGDSWAGNACIGIIKGDEKVETGGTVSFQQEFEKVGIRALRYSIGGGCNDQTIDTIQKQLNELENVDRIIVFQTDPLRDLMPNHSFSSRMAGNNENNIKRNLAIVNASPTENIDKLAQFLLERFYKQLDQFDTVKHKFLLVGGLGGIDYSVLPDSIKSLPKSVTEYLIPDFTSETPYEFMGELTDVAECVRKIWDWDKEKMIHELFEIEKKILWKNYIWQHSELFSWCHMSDQGMLKISNIIMQELIHAN